MLASCSNEMDEFAAQTENGKGFKVDLTVVEDQPQTRITWGETGAPVWEKIDKFSVLKLNNGNYNEDFRVAANAAYSTENGANFTSENVLFLGNHALVYPLQENLIDLNQRIELEAGTDGDKGLGANSIFVGSNLLNITGAGITVDGKVYNDAGYHKKVKVSVRPASAGFIFKLNEVNALDLEPADPAVEITKVELKNKTNAPFATLVTLQNENAGGTGEVLTKAINLKKDVYSTYEGLKLEAGAKAEIVALPSEATTYAAGDYEIVFTTNYGIVTVDKAIDVTNKDGKIQIAAGPTEESETNKGDNLSFAYELAEIMNRAIKGEAQPRIVRSVNVDMSTANINGLEIKNSEQLIAAYRAFDLMGKKTSDNVNFELQADGGKFELTKAAIDVITKHAAGEKAILDYSSISQLTISGYEEGFIPVIDQMPACTELVLAEGNKLKLDVNNAAAVNMFGKITNKGELQLTQGTAVEALSKQIINNGTVTFDGAETTIPTYFENNGTVEIAEGQTVKVIVSAFAANSTTDIHGALISMADANTIYVGATVNVWGDLLNTAGNDLVNLGTINIKDEAAQVILSENGSAAVNGVINVLKKDNNVKAGDTYKGYVKLAVAEDEFVMSAENMGIANYIVFSGSAIELDIQNWSTYVEFASNVKVTAEAAKVGTIFVNDVKVTIADDAKIDMKDLVNDGKIYNYGKFNVPAVVTKKGTIYDL